ncbi:DNA-binding response regulator [Candidatus Gottesmanbacteria bacterium RBG_16_43_7]|uniref:DNA-binding response regulator n=1 Tax=Candidatus Gottesmanbacteria bacterium RBG_16_43_7 TaxID=1798373 RepID=A0A1F5ZAT2_9BACT|nr:MAG: DNA-binding response regulator [Candidatus Gottesmanbacteria bacterium RBG_16_43_7]
MRILVVEDEHRIAQAIKKGLAQERYAVDLAHVGSDGYDLAMTEEYDLIILDLMLPGMDGVTVCRRLREKGIHTPILMLTAKSQVQDKVTGLDSGADDYLTKPFSFEELLARVRALSRRSKDTLGTILKHADLTIDPEQFRVERSRIEIKLSKKEFSILEFMLRNPGKVLTKDQIITHVWDYDADVLPNTVEVNIKNLRAKIDAPFKSKKPIIQTVRGFGYKLGS